MAEAPTPEHWQDIDGTDVGASATSYLTAAAAALEAPRRRSHELLGSGPGASVLDVGCGTGIALSEIAALVGPQGTVVGIDPSAAMLSQAGDRLSGAEAAVELVEGSATSTGLADDRFDAVRTERVLMHVHDPVAALAELARVTRPGGRLVLVEPDHRRLAVDTSMPDVWIRCMQGFSRALPNISAGLRAPGDAFGLGLRVLAIEPMTYQFRTLVRFNEVFDLETGRAASLAEGVSEAEFDALLADLDQRDRGDRFLAVGVMYVVALEKP